MAPHQCSPLVLGRHVLVPDWTARILTREYISTVQAVGVHANQRFDCIRERTAGIARQISTAAQEALLRLSQRRVRSKELGIIKVRTMTYSPDTVPAFVLLRTKYEVPVLFRTFLLRVSSHVMPPADRGLCPRGRLLLWAATVLRTSTTLLLRAKYTSSNYRWSLVFVRCEPSMLLGIREYALLLRPTSSSELSVLQSTSAITANISPEPLSTH